MNELTFIFFGKFFIITLCWTFSFQILNEIRHLVWDIGFGFDLKILDATVSSIKSNVGHGEVVKFSKDGLCIKTGDGSVNITKIQLPAKNPIHIRDFFNSNFKLSKNLKDNRQK
mgnify:CR=1 FL=1